MKRKKKLEECEGCGMNAAVKSYGGSELRNGDPVRQHRLCDSCANVCSYGTPVQPLLMLQINRKLDLLLARRR